MKSTLVGVGYVVIVGAYDLELVESITNAENGGRPASILDSGAVGILTWKPGGYELDLLLTTKAKREEARAPRCVGV